MKTQKVDTFKLLICNRKMQMAAEDYQPENPFESPDEAMAWLANHDEDELYRYSSSSENGGIFYHAASITEWALQKINPDDLGKILLNFDPNVYPDFVQEHLEDAVDRVPTKIIEKWLAAYPKSTWHTHKPPILPHIRAGNTRKRLSEKCVSVLHRRGVDVFKYTHPKYSAPIRDQAYWDLRLTFKSCLQWP
jgi:hypothetical protein